MKSGDPPINNKYVAKAWWDRRSVLEKKLIVASIIFIIILLIIFIISITVWLDKPEICTSPECVLSSMKLLNHMDVKADPCEDFYRFACGNFLRQPNIDYISSVKDELKTEIRLQIRNMLEEPVNLMDPKAFSLTKKFYRACMNESAIEVEGLERTKQIFKQIAGWPILDGNNWKENQFDWKDAVYKLRKIGINFEFFLILSVETDKNQTRYFVSLTDPAYSPSDLRNNVKNMYLSYMVDIAVYFGANHKRANYEQEEVLKFLLQLAKISENSRNISEESFYNLSELGHDFPEINWVEYINKILKPASEITYDDKIFVAQPSYIRDMLELIKVTKKRTIANFMVWHTLQHLINYLPSRILNRAYKFLNEVNEKSIRKPRWEMCLSLTNEKFNPVISVAYVAKYFEDSTRSHVMDIVRNIKEQFVKNLYYINWLDDNTKKMASEKIVTSVEEIIPYNDFMESLHENNVYDEVEIIEDQLLTSVLNIDYLNANLEYAKLGENIKKNWLLRKDFVTSSDIIYSPKENILRFPMGILQGIYYQRNRPQYINYGALGSVIAHEISHIFIEAEHRDLQGKLRSWWSTQSLLDYDKKLQCLSEHYRKFTLFTVEDHLNTSNTRDEDMADLAGMKVSYDTYMNWVKENGVEPQLPGLNYSPSQLFWISSAMHHCSKYSTQTLQRYITNYEHSPAQFRVNGALQNIKEFAIDFGCPTDSKMNSNNKCDIW